MFVYAFSFIWLPLLLMIDTSLHLRWLCLLQSYLRFFFCLLYLFFFVSAVCFHSLSALCYPGCSMLPFSILFLLTAFFLYHFLPAFCASILLSASASVLSMQLLQSAFFFLILSSPICFSASFWFFVSSSETLGACWQLQSW